jgi:hypothetical protein
MADINKFIYAKDDDASLRQQLVDVVNTLACTNGAQIEWLNYFNSPANIQSLKEAQAKYGIPPPNRASYKNSGLFGRWNDFCDWGDVYRFYYYAKISQDFPALNPENKQNCYLIKGYINGLEQERVSSGKRYAASNDNERYTRETEVLGEKINDFNSLFATMSCKEYMDEQDRLKSLSQEQIRLKLDQKRQAETFANTSSASGGGTKLALYVFGGVAVLIGIMLVARKAS